MYFEQDSSENWQLSDKSECFVCHKHRLAVIFYKNDTLFPNPLKAPSGNPNEQLIEITDRDTVKKIRNELNINFDETEEVAPLICGTVVNGSFTRKLRMIRADLYCLLAVS